MNEWAVGMPCGGLGNFRRNVPMISDKDKKAKQGEQTVAMAKGN